MTTSTNSTRLTSKEACTLAHKIRRETGCSLAETFNSKVSDRRIARHIPYYTDKDINRYGKALLACVRKQKGYKGTKLSDIARIRRYDEYDYNNHYTGHGYLVELSSKQTKSGHNVTIIVKVN